MQDPLSLEIPTQMTLHLDRGMREAMRRIAAVYRHESDEQLVERALRYGLVAMLHDHYEQVSPAEIAENSNAAMARMHELQLGNGSELATKAALSRRSPHESYREKIRPYMEATRALESRHELGLSDADCNEIIADFSERTSDVGLADSPEGMPPPSIERYVAAPVSEELRERLEDFFSEHPELNREQGIAALLGLGLDKAREGESLEEKKAEEMLRLAERLYAKAHRRCVG